MKKYFHGCATLDEAKALYKKLALTLHPDRSGYDSTADFQEMQNQFEQFKPDSEKYKGEFESWNATEYREIIEQLMKIPGIEIEVCGSWIWLHGDTKPVKEEIKQVETGDSMRRVWVKKKAKWAFRPTNYRKRTSREFSFDEIRNKYGSHRMETEKRKVIT